MDWKKFLQDLVELYLGSVPTTAQLAAYTKRLTDSLLVLAVAFVFVRVAYVVVGLAARGARKASRRMGRTYRTETIESLFRSICKYGIYILAAIAILRIWKVDTRSLIVGSAILGGAIGFGSQGLIQDIITGLSLLFEDQINVGDWVEVGGKAGVVEAIGLRTLKVRDVLGERHIIFNRSIGGLSRYPAGGIVVRAEIIVSQTELVEEAVARLGAMAESLGRDPTRFVEPPRAAAAGKTESGEARIRIEGLVVPFQKESVRAELERSIRRVLRGLAIEPPPENIEITFGPAET